MPPWKVQTVRRPLYQSRKPHLGSNHDAFLEVKSYLLLPFSFFIPSSSYSENSSTKITKTWSAIFSLQTSISEIFRRNKLTPNIGYWEPASPFSRCFTHNAPRRGLSRPCWNCHGHCLGTVYGPRLHSDRDTFGWVNSLTVIKNLAPFFVSEKSAFQYTLFTCSRLSEPKRPGGVLPQASASEEPLLQRDYHTRGWLFLQTVQRSLHGLCPRFPSPPSWLPTWISSTVQSPNWRPWRKHCLRSVGKFRQVWIIYAGYFN